MRLHRIRLFCLYNQNPDTFVVAAKVNQAAAPHWSPRYHLMRPQEEDDNWQARQGSLQKLTTRFGQPPASMRPFSRKFFFYTFIIIKIVV